MALDRSTQWAGQSPWVRSMELQSCGRSERNRPSVFHGVGTSEIMGSSFSQWCVAPPDVALDHKQVHVWYANLAPACENWRQFARLLAEGERVRASRFAREKDRIRFIISHGLLRQILGGYARTPAGSLRFGVGHHGKPYLAGAGSKLGIRFNMAHSEDHALFAVALGTEVGVDIERIRPVPDAMGIAEAFFSVREVGMLRALPPELLTIGFLDSWTRKEAFVKALGTGLSHPLNQFDVSTVLDGIVHPSGLDDCPVETGRWQVVPLRPAQDVTAAAAFCGVDWTFHLWQASDRWLVDGALD